MVHRTARLRIDPLTVADAEPLFRALDDPRVGEVIGGPDVTTVAALRERIARLLSGPPPDDTASAWVNFVLRAVDGRVIGRIEATLHDGGDVTADWAEIAYVLSPAEWGHGYAAEAVGWLVDHLADDHGVRDVWAAVLPGNDRSRRLLERLGFAGVSPPDAIRMGSYDPGDDTFHLDLRFRGPLPTERLAFRPWRETDAAFVHDMYARPEVYRFLGARPSPSTGLGDAEARIARWRARAGDREGIWAITVPVDAVFAPVGSVLLVPLPRSDGVASSDYEIGWHLHPDAWGHGYATEAARAVIALARRRGHPQVRAVVFPDNARSRAVCTRLGMTETGLTDRWYGVELVEYLLSL